MFGSANKKQQEVHPRQGNSGNLNSLVTGTYLEGDINSENDFRIDGELHGTLDCKGKVIVGGSGVVEGKITCHECVVEGNFNGEMTVEEVLSVHSNANICGTIVTDKLTVQAGAIFNVQCKMGNASAINIPIEEEGKILATG